MKRLLLIISALIAIASTSTAQKPVNFKALQKKYPWSIPFESFHDDTVVIKGKIENYDPQQSGFATLLGSTFNLFEDVTAASMPINADGTFEKKIKTSYPICSEFCEYNQNGQFHLPFFAYPGDTVIINAKVNNGRLECTYPQGRCKNLQNVVPYLVLLDRETLYELKDCKGSFTDFINECEKLWNTLINKVINDAKTLNFSKEETGMALELSRCYYAKAILAGLMFQQDHCYTERIEGKYRYLTLSDTARMNQMKNVNNYKFFKHIDFNDPVFFCSDMFILLNYMDHSLPPFSSNKRIGRVYPPRDMESSKKFFYHADSLLRKTLQTNNNTPVVQMVMYNSLKTFIDRTWTDIEIGLPTDSIKEIRDHIMPLFAFAPVRKKVEELFVDRLSNNQITVPLHHCAVTEFIDSLRTAYPGKYLYLDFWAMGCGPCRSTIQASKDLREKIGNNPDIKLVFVNGDNPNYTKMHEYVATHLANEVNIYPGEDNFTLLRDVFGFAAIPHFEVISPDGQVVKERFIKFDLRDHADNYEQFKKQFDILKNKL